MKAFFDTHLHLPKPTNEGVCELVRHIQTTPGFLGGLLILNTDEEVDAVANNYSLLPKGVVVVPHFRISVNRAPLIFRTGWFKVHPTLHKLDIDMLDEVVSNLRRKTPTGVIVHCFPWGPETKFNVSLAYVTRLARDLPHCIILAAHGGGYESWQFRAHAGVFKNVHFDFSMTLDYYQNSDLLRPVQRYLKYSPTRIHFGSDWPDGNLERQLTEMQRLATEVEIAPKVLEELLISNAKSCWPEAF